MNTTQNRDTCIIRFKDESEKAKAFYELVRSKAKFSGVEKDTLVIHKKDCELLESKNIIYQKL
jgi:CRISPR/Cas system-associated protein Csm6